MREFLGLTDAVAAIFVIAFAAFGHLNHPIAMTLLGCLLVANAVLIFSLDD